MFTLKRNNQEVVVIIKKGCVGQVHRIAWEKEGGSRRPVNEVIASTL